MLPTTENHITIATALGFFKRVLKAIDNTIERPIPRAISSFVISMSDPALFRVFIGVSIKFSIIRLLIGS